MSDDKQLDTKCTIQKLTPKMGQPEFEPTDEQRKEVTRMAEIGLSYKEIAAHIKNPKDGKPISHVTLQKTMLSDLFIGRAKKTIPVMQKLEKHMDLGKAWAFRIWFDKVFSRDELMGMDAALSSFDEETFKKMRDVLVEAKIKEKLKENG